MLKYEDTAAAAAAASSHPISSSSSTSSEGYRAEVRRAEVSADAAGKADPEGDAAVADAHIESNVGGASLRRPPVDTFETTSAATIGSPETQTRAAGPQAQVYAQSESESPSRVEETATGQRRHRRVVSKRVGEG